MLRLALSLIITVAVMASSATTITTTAQESNKSRGMRLQNGKLFIDEKLVHSGFSIRQTEFHFLNFYVPARGLFIISDAPFDDAVMAGTFDGPMLTFNAGGYNIRLKSSTPMLDAASVPVWVKFDPNFNIDVKGVMVGYSDTKDAAYAWPDHLRKARSK